MEDQSKQEIWNVLDQNQLPDNDLLYELSGMLTDDIKQFKSTWDALSINLKRKLIVKLREISEVDFAVDYSAIYQIGIVSHDPEICVTSIKGLSENEDIRLIPQMVKLLQNNENAKVRAASAQFLASFVLLGELGKIPEYKFFEIVSTLISTLTNADEVLEVKCRALESVAYTSIQQVPDLIQHAYNSSEEQMVISAVLSMGRSADKRWADIVVNELLNPNPIMRCEATRACGELQIHKAVSELIDLAEDSDTQVQEIALWSLGQIGGTRSRRFLESLLGSDDDALSASAQQAIDELDFYQNGISSFLGPPSEFNGEGEDSWFTPEGFFIRDEDNTDQEDDQTNNDIFYQLDRDHADDI